MATNMTLSQIQANPFLNAIVAPYLEPGVQLQSGQAGVANTQQNTANQAASNPGIVANSTVDQARAQAVNFTQQTRQLFNQNGGVGKVSPKVYNQALSSMPAGMSLSGFETAFDQYIDRSQPAIDYQNSTGIALQAQYQQNKTAYQKALDLYNQIPGAEKGGLGGELSRIPGIAPSATAYQNYISALPKNLQAQLPSVTDSTERAQKKISDYNTTLQSTYRTNNASLDPNYLPKQNNQTQPEQATANALTSGQNKIHTKQNGNPLITALVGTGAVAGLVAASGGADAPLAPEEEAGVLGAADEGGGQSILSRFLGGKPTPSESIPPTQSGINFQAGGHEALPDDILNTPEGQNPYTSPQALQGSKPMIGDTSGEKYISPSLPQTAATISRNPLIAALQRHALGIGLSAASTGASALIDYLMGRGQSQGAGGGSPAGY